MLFVSVVALTFEYVFRLVMIKPIHIPYPEKSRSTLSSNYSTFLSCDYSARGWGGVGGEWARRRENEILLFLGNKSQRST